MSKSVEDLRKTFRPKIAGGPILIRPDSGFIEVTEEEIGQVLDAIELLPIKVHLGETVSPLEMLALRLLTESHF